MHPSADSRCGSKTGVPARLGSASIYPDYSVRSNPWRIPGIADPMLGDTFGRETRSASRLDGGWHVEDDRRVGSGQNFREQRAFSSTWRGPTELSPLTDDFSQALRNPIIDNILRGVIYSPHPSPKPEETFAPWRIPDRPATPGPSGISCCLFRPARAALASVGFAGHCSVARQFRSLGIVAGHRRSGDDRL